MEIEIIEMEDYQWSEAEKAPMTDEAVEITLRRLEALYGKP